MEKSTRDPDPAKFALVRLNSPNDALKLHKYLVSVGFPEVSFVREVPKQLYTLDKELDSLVFQSGTKNNRIKKQNKKSDEENQLFQNGNATDSETGLTASVIAALNSLSSLAQGCLLKEEVDGEHRASSSSTTSPETQTAIPSPIPFVARPRGSRMQNSDDPTVYASCKLCSNKIMSSRLSNLTNHVRRHAALKQYQCCHCGYSHNEMAKVRLHMQHNHSDFESSPVDGMCKEMQQQWANLMEQCFPGHAKRFAQNNSFVAISDTPSEKRSESKISSGDESEIETKLKEIKTVFNQPVSPSDVFTCSRCGEVVQSAKLLTHLIQKHSNDCFSFACSECNFLANYPWKVLLHIANEHREKPGENSVVMTPSGTNYLLHVPSYFPEFSERRGYTIEDKLLKSDFERKCSEYLQRDLTALKAVQCELCFKLFTADQNVSVLLSHAKNHFGIRCFNCPECSFKGSDIGVVSSHISRKHPESEETPSDNSVENNKEAWQKLACCCFPDLEGTLMDALSDSRKADLKRKSTVQPETTLKKQIRQ